VDANCTCCIAERIHKIRIPHTCDQDYPTTSQGTASAYTFDNYQDDAGITAIYPDHGKGTPAAFAYLSLKLNGEAGEVGEAYAKFLRGDYDWAECKRLIRKEIGDVTWYISQIINELNDSFGDIAADNIRKLSDRKSRNVIHGSGDTR
jgi:NTP pyrophosphatase (non-canonical NTP hydrolase)